MILALLMCCAISSESFAFRYPSPSPLDARHNLAVLFEGTVEAVFVNGVPVTEEEFAKIRNTTTGILNITVNVRPTKKYFGDIQEVTVIYGHYDNRRCSKMYIDFERDIWGAVKSDGRLYSGNGERGIAVEAQALWDTAIIYQKTIENALSHNDFSLSARSFLEREVATIGTILSSKEKLPAGIHDALIEDLQSLPKSLLQARLCYLKAARLVADTETSEMVTMPRDAYSKRLRH